MKVLCYGSLNIDFVYQVPHFVRGGETLASCSLSRNPGGKGANQAGALAKAGCDTYMAGKIGSDGLFLIDSLKSYGVNCEYIKVSKNPTGQAFIQLDEKKQNAIVLYPGENKNITIEEIDSIINHFGKDDWLILQNEINNNEYIINMAYSKGMRICLNPAPFDDSVFSLPLNKVDLLVVNEIEGASLSGSDNKNYLSILDSLKDKIHGEIIMTVGKNGSFYQCGDTRYYQDIIDYPIVDTTAAGDTFIGYYIASIMKGFSVQDSLYYATKASGITVSQEGALDSIPFSDDVFGR